MKLVCSSEIISETVPASVSPCVSGQIPIRTPSTEARHSGHIADFMRILFHNFESNLREQNDFKSENANDERGTAPANGRRTALSR